MVRRHRLDLARIAALALCWFAAARYAAFPGPVGGHFALISFPAGIALAALLLYGIRLWPGVAIGAFWFAFSSSLPPGAALFDTLLHTLEPVAAQALLSIPALKFDRRIARLRDYLLLILVGTVVGPAVTVSAGAIGAMAMDMPGGLSALTLLGNRWMESALGVAAVTPLPLALRRDEPARADVTLEGMLAFAILMLWSAVVFLGWLSDYLGPYAGGFTVYPLVCCIALRFGQRGVMPATLLVMALSFSGAHRQIGYFADDFAATGLRNLWLYNLILTMTGAMIATVTVDRRQTLIRLRQAARVFENTQEALMITDTRGRILSVNPAFTEITGYDAAEILGKDKQVLQSGRHEPAFFEAQERELQQSGRWQGEVWNRRKTGEIYPEWQTISTVTDSEGRTFDYVTVFSDISQLKVSQQKLEHLAHHDVLTGLPNRLLFRDRLEHAIRRADRAGSRLAVLFLDLDRFKHVNDSLGHTVGDALLQEVASRLRGFLRRDDTLARLGGDEFTILMEGLRQGRDAAVLAEKLIESLGEPFHLHNYELLVGASVGISIYPQDAQDAESLLRNADAAMYRAKENGRNTHRFYSKDMTSTALERVVLEAQLRQALEREELQLFYQPEVDLATGELVGLEALVRWQHPGKGFIEPARFIQLAEETGLIVPLGEWALHAACRQGKKWLDAGLDFGCIAVNISASQVLRGTLKQSIERALAATGYPPERLEIEINEGFIMRQPNQSIGHFMAVRELGVQLAIDDFGTGHSSLSYLKQLPIDKLKIDRSFIQDLPGDSNDALIAKAVIALAHSLQYRVIAEGVETVGQLDFLRLEGCDEAQGYLYSHPMDAARVEELVLRYARTKGARMPPGLSKG